MRLEGKVQVNNDTGSVATTGQLVDLADVTLIGLADGQLIQYNSTTEKWENVVSPYLRLDTANDPLTGDLEITPSSGEVALRANKDIVLKAGQRIIFDG